MKHSPQVPSAVLLYGENLSADDRNVGRVLDLFGISWEAVSAREFTRSTPSAGVDSGAFCILSSAPCLADAIQDIGESDAALPRSITNARSVYVYGFDDTEACNVLLRLLTGNRDSTIRSLNAPLTHLSVTNDRPEICGPLSGMEVSVQPDERTPIFEIPSHAEGFERIVTADDNDIFFGVTCSGTRFYLNACLETIDISRSASKYFDVKQHFCSAVPIVMYLKWAFRDVDWSDTETSGCLIVDDPLLKPRYGFLNFLDTLELMDRHNFTTTVAFIPWNWRRTDPRTVNLFRQRPDRFSVCVHGCDHTAAEFAEQSASLLDRKTKAANEKMAFLFQRTSLPHDRIMVFPQGAFSPESGRALKVNGFAAAVNTEVAPKAGRNETTIADLWNVAIMKYGAFPIFTRRYISHGLENFAFDALLGKPCLIVAHHDAFKNRGRDLVHFITQLNSLKWGLRWRTLGDAVRQTFSGRPAADGVSMTRIGAEQGPNDNAGTEPRAMTLTNEEGIATRIKTHARRYVSEWRDNYLSQSDFLYERAVRLRHFLKS